MRLTSLVLATLLFATTSNAQSNCGSRELVVEKLGTKYGEHQSSIGTQGGGKIIEVWYSTETGTWTLLQTFASGRTCIIAAGQNWQTRDPVVIEEDSL